MNERLLTRAASISDLKKLAKSRIPAFSFDYVEGGCNNNNAIDTNRTALDAIQLEPDYFSVCKQVDLSVELFGRRYSAPIGIAPIGLSGVVWPNTSVYHAKTANDANIRLS